MAFVSRKCIGQQEGFSSDSLCLNLRLAEILSAGTEWHSVQVLNIALLTVKKYKMRHKPMSVCVHVCIVCVCTRVCVRVCVKSAVTDANSRVYHVYSKINQRVNGWMSNNILFYFDGLSLHCMFHQLHKLILNF